MKMFFKILFRNLYEIIRVIVFGALIISLYLGIAYLLGSFIVQYFDARLPALFALCLLLEIALTILIGCTWEQYKSETRIYRCFCGYCKTEDCKK